MPAFATVHPLAKSERSNAPEDTQGFVSAELQDPPGLTPPEFETGGPDQSQAETSQPVVAVITHQPQSEDADPFDPTTFPKNGPLKPEG